MNINMNDNKSSDVFSNIDLAYDYTENFLKDRKSEIKHLDWRLGTFLGFAGLLLRFGADLPDNQPSYLLTKILLLTTSLASVIIASWGLRSKSQGVLVDPSYLMEDECFQKENLEVKAMIINTHTTTSHALDLLAQKKQLHLNRAITCLTFSVVFLAINGILVTLLEN